jgi:hypothetical protein
MPIPALCREVPEIACRAPEPSSKDRHNSRTARERDSAGDRLALIAEAGLPPVRAPAPRPWRQPARSRRGRSHSSDSASCGCAVRRSVSGMVRARLGGASSSEGALAGVAAATSSPTPLPDGFVRGGRPSTGAGPTRRQEGTVRRRTTTGEGEPSSAPPPTAAFVQQAVKQLRRTERGQR